MKNRSKKRETEPTRKRPESNEEKTAKEPRAEKVLDHIACRDEFFSYLGSFSDSAMPT